ncbi:RNA-binding protein 39-like [Schistocerca gregaria]|uniref:RNA-binding protein 39-like n=1 Tax=Schistocerca gregaria TaxID=7010 RepID=UPI00211DB83B|nr:RNA-binding protein 39-like [Schistocerca gregaria]
MTSSQPSSVSEKQSASASKQPVRLYVGNLDYAITEEMVRELFSQFGQLDMCKLQTEANGQSKGRAFIQYNNRENALAAFYYLNQKEVAGRTLRVDFTRDSRAKDHTLPCVNTGGQPPSTESQKAGMSSEPYESVGDLDDEGVKLTRQTRYFLMQSLAGISQSSEADGRRADQPSESSNSATSYPVSHVSPRINLPSPGTPTACVCLKNMFDPSVERDPQFDLEIEEDVREVAEAHGRVVHLHVDKTSFVRVWMCARGYGISSLTRFFLRTLSQGDVYLRMEGVEAMKNVVKDVHGRFFAGRLVRAEYLAPDVYTGKFPSDGCSA